MKRSRRELELRKVQGSLWVDLADFQLAQGVSDVEMAQLLIEYAGRVLGPAGSRSDEPVEELAGQLHRRGPRKRDEPAALPVDGTDSEAQPSKPAPPAHPARPEQLRAYFDRTTDTADFRPEHGYIPITTGTTNAARVRL